MNRILKAGKPLWRAMGPENYFTFVRAWEEKVEAIKAGKTKATQI